MRRQRLTNGQVVIGLILFVLVMGLVGRLDYESQVPEASRQYQDQVRLAGQADECLSPAIRLAGGR